MSRFSLFGLLAVALFLIALCGCQGLVRGVSGLTVNLAGAGTGTVTSSPAGINCPGTCSGTFTNVPQVTLTASPATGFGFAGWSGACTGTTATCSVAATADVTATFSASLQSINHIIFLAQENRSFDSYFGAMRGYWAANGIPDQQFDGLAQFTPPGNPAAAPTNPGCDPAFPYPPNSFCQINPSSPAQPSFHMLSMCVENPSPSWAEAHRGWNVHFPPPPSTTIPPPTMDGFVDAAANDARHHVNKQGVFAPLFDTNGVRAMGYYDGTDLNYYYALATAFATSDAWFSPVMTRTPPNREFLIAGTSHGYVYQRGANPPLDTPLIPAKTIFEALDSHNPPISWKIYVPTQGTACATPPADTDPACLIRFSYLHDFAFGATIKNNPAAYKQNIVPISQFTTDAQNGTLPQVAQIEPASSAGLDEHPTDDDPPPGSQPCCSMQDGARFVKTLIDSVMNGPSWQDSVFILTFDEAGGLYDHVPPYHSVSPDGILPKDLFSNDPCFGNTQPDTVCDFSYSGYRVPLVVVSPFAKANGVSHQQRDLTAILKLIEKRFGLNALTARDAAQVDMDDTTDGFFDFTNAPLKTPPSLPAQTVLGPTQCYLDHLP